MSNWLSGTLKHAEALLESVDEKIAETAVDAPVTPLRARVPLTEDEERAEREQKMYQGEPKSRRKKSCFLILFLQRSRMPPSSNACGATPRDKRPSTNVSSPRPAKRPPRASLLV